MTRDPAITVVIPAYNASRFVARAIESVVTQTVPIHECIVVDDGSLDDTSEVVEAIGDSRVRCIHQTNRGVAAARNLGGHSGTGDVIAFLDADDAWLPRKLELQLELFAGRPDLGLIYSGLHLVDDAGAFIGRMEPAGEADALPRTLLIEKPYMTGVGSTAVIPRPVFDRVGGFDERMSTAADRDMACRIALHYPVAPVEAYLVLYTQHPNQMHLDPNSVHLDITRMFDKIFGDAALPDAIAGSRRRAEANLFISLAGLHARRGDRRSVIEFGLRAFKASPARVLAAVRRLMSTQGPSG